MINRIAVLAGDGVGPEVMASALEVLRAVLRSRQEEWVFEEALIGGAAYELHGSHFPESTKATCARSSAILFGSIGGPIAEANLPKWQNCEHGSILALRKTFRFHANLRPTRIFSCLAEISPLKDSVLARGVDFLIVRELIDDIYFGAHSRYEENGLRHASDLAHYDEASIRLVTRTAFEAARKRRQLLTSVDKQNVLSTSKLWREIVTETAAEFPDIQLQHMLVDNCALQLVRNPSQFDVLLTSNLFGDILSDEASAIPGSLGLSPSASFNDQGFALYEPCGGSAPDIAGKGIANPIAQILSAAMMLRYSFSLAQEAEAIESAVERALETGARTADIALDPSLSKSTKEMTKCIIEQLA